MAETRTLKEGKNNNNSSMGNFFIAMVMFWSNIIVVAVLSFILNFAVSDLIRNIVVEGLLSSLFIFLLAHSNEEDLFAYDNKENYGRILAWYLLGIIIEVSSVFLPTSGWPIVSTFVIMTLFTNPIIGLICGCGFLLGTVLLTEASLYIFLLYFVSGVIGICMFYKLDDRYRVVVPLIVTALGLLINETAEIVMYENASLSIEQFLIPMANVTITILLIVIALKYLSSKVIFKHRDRYMEINDPECPLLVELKELNKDEYYRSVHIAYFCDKISKKLNLDDQAVKAGGYYQSIGILKGDKSWRVVEPICDEYSFPPKAKEILKEYLIGTGFIKGKETGILYFSDAVITSILYLIKNGEQDIDYDQIIDAVFKKKMASPRFAQSDLSIDELRIMKQLFKDEKLYYDFLR